MASNFHPYAVAFSTVFLFLFHRAMGSHHIYAEYQSLDPTDTTTVKHAYRTGFHFQPPRHWINDPNGPMYYKGLYHLFYQYNPKGAVWGNIVWAHSVSKDLVNWIALNHAIQPSKPFDAKGCWSGSATIVPGKGPVIIYTGIDTQGRQVQNYAVPENVSDPFLVKWVKPDDNPIAVPPPGINISSFRDPTTAWFGPDGHWRMVIGSRKDLRGLALLYKSRDFKKWTQGVQPLHSAPGTGMWECPDFFPVSLEGVRGLDTNAAGIGTKHVLKASFDLTRFEYYTVGEYHPGKDVYVPDNTSADGWSGLRYDYGNFYASKSFYDPVKRRRVLWGWVNESDTSHNDVKKGWSGIQAIPRTIWLDPNHRQLRTWPVVEVQKLRGKGVKMAGLILPKQRVIKVKGITAAQADVEVIFQLGGLEKAEEYDPKWVNAEDLCAIKGAEVEGGVGPFGLFTLATPTLEERTPVFFRVFKRKDVEKKFVVLMCSDARSSSLNKELYRPSFGGFVDADLSSKKKLSLRTLVDQSVVESFAEGGKTAITSRVYPVGREAHLHVFNNGREVVKVESLKAWSMRKPLFMNQKIP